MALLLPSCAETARRLSLAQDCPLSLGERVGVWLHLGLCRFCRRYRGQLNLLRRGYRVFQQKLAEISEAKLPEESRRKILDSLLGQQS